MATIGQILVKLGLDPSALEKGLTKSLGSLKSFSANLKQLGSDLTKFVTLPILAIGAASLKMAAAAEESESFFDVAFDGMSDSVRSWSDQMAKSLGVSGFDLRENAATIKVMASSMGLAEKDAIEMSKGIAVLTQDLASFRDLAPEEAFNKLRAGITGETEPLKQLGVLVDENTVKQAAYAAGIAKTGSVLTNTQKVAARWLTIQQQLSLANGDLIRTGQSFTNQMRRLKANLGDAAREMGGILLPAATKLIKIFNNLVTTFRNLSPEIKKQVIFWGGIAAAVGPALLVLAGLSAILPAIAAGLTTILIPLALLAIKVALVVGALVGGFILAKAAVKDFSVVIDLLKAAAFKSFSGIIKILAGFLKGVLFIAAQFDTGFAGKIQKSILGLNKVTAEFDKKAAVNFKTGADKMKGTANELLASLKGLVGPEFDAIKAKLGSLFTTGGAAPAGGGGGGGDEEAPPISEAMRQELAATASIVDNFSSQTAQAFGAFGNSLVDALFESGTNWNEVVGNALKQLLIAIAKFVIQALAKFALLKIFGIGGGGLGGIAGFGGKLLGLATGGVVTSPTIAQIGEKGPEAVVPLNSSKASGLMGTGGEQRIIQMLDGRVLSEVVVMGMPRVVRANAGVKI